MKDREKCVWSRAAMAIPGVMLLGATVALGAGFAGELDPTFGSGGIVTTSGIYSAQDVAIQPILGSERYLVAGEAASSKPTGTSLDWVVLAYTPSGSLDPTFGARGDGTVRLFGTDPNYTRAFDVSLDDQNRVLVGGTSTVRTVTVYGTNKKPTGTKSYTGLTVVRLTADGRLDTSFNGTGVATVWAGSPDGYYELGASAVAVPPSLGGGVLASGICYYVESPAKGRTPAQIKRRTFLAKFRDDGTLDYRFGMNGIAYDPRSSSPLRGAVLLQRDGKIVVGHNMDFTAASPGSYTDTAAEYWVVSRFTATGALDTTFGSGGRVIVSGARVRMVTVNATDDSIVAVGDGSAAGGDGLVARYLANGAPDWTFNGDGYASVTGWVNGGGDLALQSDGRVVFCGGTLVGRFTADGSPDASFGVAGYASPLPSGWLAWAVAEAADGIVVAGYAESGSIFVGRYGK